MKGKIFVAMLLVCALSSVVVFGVYAQAGNLGVKTGDNFTYSFVAFWSSTNPSVVVPSLFSDMNKTRSIKINVTDASSATFANLNVSSQMIDGTEISAPGYIDVVSGRGTREAFLFIIGANLTAGDKAYPLADSVAVKAGAAAESFTITETVTLTYLGIAREVNHYHESKTDENSSVTRDAYYDRTTGILLEMTVSHAFAVTPDETDSEKWKITQFNSAVVPSDGTSDGTDGTGSGFSWGWVTGALPEWEWYVVIVAVVVVVAALVAVVTLRRRKKPAAQAPATVPVQPQTPV